MDKSGVFIQTKNVFVTMGELGTMKLVVVFLPTFQGRASFVDRFCYLCLMFVKLSSLFIATLWSPAGKALTSCLSCM